MSDPKPKRRVTAQIPITASTPPASSSTPVARARARVNPASISTPTPPPTRPDIRLTPSSASLRTSVSLTPTTSTPLVRARSPLPPASSTPATRARSHVGPTSTSASPTVRTPTSVGPAHGGAGLSSGSQRVRAAVSVAGKPSARPPVEHRTASEPEQAGPGPASAVSVRARVSALSRAKRPAHLTVTAPAASPLLSPNSLTQARAATLSPSPSASRGLSILGDIDLPPHLANATYTAEPEPTSNHSSPVRPLRQLEPHHLLATVVSQYATASCPPTPVPASATHPGEKPPARLRPHLPWNPHSNPPPPLPQPPISPTLRTIALPSMTPTGSTHEREWAGSNACDSGDRRFSASGSDLSVPGMSGLAGMHGAGRIGGRPERDRMSGSTAVDEDDDGKAGTTDKIDHRADGAMVEIDGELDGSGSRDEIDIVLDVDARQAKVDRKIADLEISNMSLLAINRSLEATKAKQRAEIVKLRRQLRESLSGHAVAPLASPRADLESPSLASLGAAMGLEDWAAEEAAADPALEARWDRLHDLVGTMLRRAEDAVARGRQEAKVGAGRVLGWLEVEQLNDAVSPGTSPRPSLAADHGESGERGDADEGRDVGASEGADESSGADARLDSEVGENWSTA
ncbi:hypothetical protein Q5752_000501 [Cryptotrichosporon argae]